MITGGARGIGAAIVAAMQPDHDIVLTYNTTEPDGAPGVAVQADLSDPATPARCVEAALDAFGRLDVVIHNAGAVEMSPLDGFAPDDYARIFDVNLFAAQGLLAAALPHLHAGASMISISSVNAILPPKGAVMYGASKAALELWTKGAARELGPKGIRVNAVAPGPVDVPGANRDAAMKQAFVDLTALGRMGQPADIANAVRFLASDAASFITGEVLRVSGGYRL